MEGGSETRRFRFGCRTRVRAKTVGSHQTRPAPSPPTTARRSSTRCDCRLARSLSRRCCRSGPRGDYRPNRSPRPTSLPPSRRRSPRPGEAALGPRPADASHRQRRRASEPVGAPRRYDCCLLTGALRLLSWSGRGHAAPLRDRPICVERVVVRGVRLLFDSPVQLRERFRLDRGKLLLHQKLRADADQAHAHRRGAPARVPRHAPC
jgi:hypothetical protein